MRTKSRRRSPPFRGRKKTVSPEYSTFSFGDLLFFLLSSMNLFVDAIHIYIWKGWLFERSWVSRGRGGVWERERERASFKANKSYKMKPFRDVSQEKRQGTSCGVPISGKTTQERRHVRGELRRTLNILVTREIVREYCRWRRDVGHMCSLCECSS